ncbi:MAG: sel1 repeat family protein, partial [Magnetococcales bacterium]|nr:sel1 repeat family protein [Magnetococcales bacterium]
MGILGFLFAPFRQLFSGVIRARNKRIIGPQTHSLIQAAQSGHVEAQFLLGYILSEGEGVDRDLEQAIHWYRQAAVRGHDNARINLAIAYCEGDGVEKDMAKAYGWVCLAAFTETEKAPPLRDEIARHLTPEEIAAGQAWAQSQRDVDLQEAERKEAE